MDTRLERERAFHDRAYAHDVRAPARRFYTVTGALLEWYKDTLAANAPGSRVLEYGCGPGSRAFDLARAGATVVGIDISPVAIEQASARGRAEGVDDRLEFRVMDAEHLDFADASFDMICGSGILHHLDLVRAFAEIARVLAPGGLAVFEEPLGHNPAINAYRKRTPALRTVDEHPLRMSDLQLAERYFEQVETRFFSLSSLVAIPLRNLPGFDAVVRGFDSLDRWLFRAAPALRRHAWMVGMTMRGPRAAYAGSSS